MPVFEVDIRGAKYQIDAADEAQAATQVLKLSQQPQHFELGQAPGQAPVGPKVSQGDAYGLGAADIGGMGFADELAAPIGAMISGDPTEKVLGEMRGQSKAAQEQHPNSFLTGQVGGGVAQAVAGGLPAVMRGGASVLGRVLAGMGVGGVSGAMHGAGTGEDMTSRLKNAMVEGGTGLAVGAALPALGAGAANLYQAGADALGRRGMPASTDIMRLVSQYVGDAQTAQANIAKAGPNAMLADSGPSARDFLDATIQRGGPGANVARNAIDQRAAAEGQRITGALDQSLGQPQGVETMRTAIRDGSAAARHAAYDGPNGAYSKPIDYASPQGMAIENMVKTRVPKSAIDEANALMRAEGAKSKQILAHVADDGTVIFETMPDVRQLDYITRGLNEVADQADGAGKLGGTTAKGRAYGNLSREIRDNLKTAVPEYGQALETAADPIRRSKAVEFGAEMLNDTVPVDRVANFVDGITGPERRHLGEGIRSNIDHVMGNVKRALTDPNVDARESLAALKKLSSRNSRNKLALALGEPEADALTSQMDEAAKGFELRAGTASNSATARRQNIFETVDRLTAPGPVRTLASGKPLNATQRMIQALTGQTEEALQGRKDAIYAGAANLMTKPATPQLLGQVDKFGQRDLATQLMRERIANALIGSARPGAVLAGSTVRQRLGPRRQKAE